MSDNSAIEWTDATWNPVVGCEKIAQGCKHCYAKTLHDKRHKAYQAGAKLPAQYAKPFEEVQLMPERLSQPLKWRKPKRIFVNSVSDLFHESVPFEFIAAVFGVMAACPQHVFQVLTKRPERMREFFEYIEQRAEMAKEVFPNDTHEWRREHLLSAQCLIHGLGETHKHRGVDFQWPLPQVWLGTSISTQKDADKNILELVKCPAAVRFVSAEPLIEDVDLWMVPQKCPACGAQAMRSLLADDGSCWELDHCEACDVRWWCQPHEQDVTPEARPFPKIDWVIVGGESGPGARPCDVAWIRSIVQQCKAAGVACFVKQLGSTPVSSRPADFENGDTITGEADLILRDRKGGDPSEWPEDLRVREFPAVDGALYRAVKGSQ